MSADAQWEALDKAITRWKAARDVGHWDKVEEALFALRERLQRQDEEVERLTRDKDNFEFLKNCAVIAQRMAEARVQELEADQTQGVFVRTSYNEKLEARVQQLEDALRDKAYHAGYDITHEGDLEEHRQEQPDCAACRVLKAPTYWPGQADYKGPYPKEPN